MPPRRGDSRARFTGSWPRTSSKSTSSADSNRPPPAPGAGWGEGQAPGQEIHHLGQGVHRVELQALDHRGFPGVFPGEDELQPGLPGG